MKPFASVRQAGPGDLDALHALRLRYFDEIEVPQHRRDDRAASASSIGLPNAVWLAYGTGDPIGTIALRALATPGSCEVRRLYVVPSARRSGAAHALLDKLEDFAVAQGYEWAFLDSRSDLRVALGFYSARGYMACDRYNDNPEATIFMRRRLLPAKPLR